MDDGLFEQVNAFLNETFGSFKAITEEIKQYISSFYDLVSVNMYELKGSKGPAVLIANKYGTKKDLEDNVKTNHFRLKNRIVAFKKKLNERKAMIQSGIIDCAMCDGSGNLKKLGWHREEGVVTPTTEKVLCPRCGGKGKLTFDRNDKALINLILARMEGYADFCDNLLELTNKIAEEQMHSSIT
jgi:DnaJ-class molecular chaperone